MENNNKSQAEIYREERKERLAKAAAKNAKKKPTFSKSKKIIGKVVAVVLAVAVALGAVGGILNFFGTPQKVIKITVAGDKDISFTLAEFNYYYFYIWQAVESKAYQTEYQYSQYFGEGAGLTYTGYDYKKSPANQIYKDDYSQMTGIKLSDLKVQSATWADVLKYAAIDQLIQVKYGAKMAKAAGLSLTAEQQSAIDSQMNSYISEAKKGDYSTNRYLRKLFGNGITEKILRGILEDQSLSNNYYSKITEDAKTAITEETLNEKYNANPDLYNVATLRSYVFEADYEDGATDEEKTAAREKAKAAADEFLAYAIDEENFVKLAEKELKKNDKTKDEDPDKYTMNKNVYKSEVTQNVSEEAANWALNAERVNGEAQVFKADDDTYFVLMIIVPMHKDTTSVGNDVRHILFKFPDAQKDADGNEIPLNDAQKAEVKAEAEKVLEEYMKNPTEENFISLTKEYSEDVDSEGNPNNDGLYEGVTSSSSYAEQFLNWSIDDTRKTGDVEIIETKYGYHIMYYVKSQGETWQTNIKVEIISNFQNDLESKINAEYTSKVNMNSLPIKFAFKQETKHIDQRVLNITQQSA